MPSDLFIRLSNAKKRGRAIHLRHSEIDTIERVEGDHSHPDDVTLVRIKGSEYVYYVSEEPETILSLIAETRR